MEARKRRREIPVSEFKARCLRLVDEINQKGESVVITKRGKPVVVVLPADPSPPQRLRGMWKGQVKITGDIVHFDTSDEWDALRDD